MKTGCVITTAQTVGRRWTRERDFMNKFSLEDLGWKRFDERSYYGCFIYERNDEQIIIDTIKRKLQIVSCSELSFATLEAIRDVVISNAIY